MSRGEGEVCGPAGAAPAKKQEQLPAATASVAERISASGTAEGEVSIAAATTEEKPSTAPPAACGHAEAEGEAGGSITAEGEGFLDTADG